MANAEKIKQEMDIFRKNLFESLSKNDTSLEAKFVKEIKSLIRDLPKEQRQEILNKIIGTLKEKIKDIETKNGGN